MPRDRSTRSPALCDWVFEHARERPDAPAIDSPGHRLSYGVLARRVRRLSRELHRLDVREHDHVLSLLPNSPAAVVASLAVQDAGAVSVEASREWTAERLAEVVRQSRPRLVVVGARDLGKVAGACRSAGVRSLLLVRRDVPEPALDLPPIGATTAVLTAGGELEEREDGEEGGEEGEPTPAGAPGRDRSAVTLLLFTSGSTGTPRAVLQTVGNIEANTRSIVSALRLTEQDRAMLILPLSYCYGRSILQTHLYVGGSVFLAPGFAYPAVVVDAIRAERCTGFAGVPLTFELLRRQADLDLGSLRGLRYATQAGGAMSQATIDWARAALHPAELFVMYGQTEATARLTVLPPARATEKRGSIGVPIPGVELRIAGAAGEEVPHRSPGHLVARGPNVMPGYYGAPEETARTLRDGWLWTGDLAYRDEEGFYFLVGREKEIIKVGGHRASPAEIEAVLAQHPAVADVAVAGVQDALKGEVPGALVVVRVGARLTERELLRFSAERLPGYLVPRTVRFASAVPRGPAGKVMRELVARALLRAAEEAPVTRSPS